METNLKHIDMGTAKQILKQLTQIQLMLEETQSLGDWITREHAMRFLGYRNTSMRELEKSGKLIFSMVGRKKYYLKSGIIALLDEHICDPN